MQVTTGAKGSIVIPAHNEEASITRCLVPLARLVSAGEVDVIVSLNGCSDSTEERARAFAGVSLVLSDVPSKAAALRRAEGHSELMPRIYVDADVRLDGDSARLLLEWLAQPGRLAARPSVEHDTEGASWVVRAYYRARSRIPELDSGLWGAGCYALSAEGRYRFETFPDEVADDLFVDSRFARHEIHILRDARVVVTTPRRASDLLAILGRHQEGNTSLRRADSSVPASTGQTLRALLRGTPRLPGPFVDLVVYIAFAAASRLPRRSRRWARDESSRHG